VPIGAGDKFLKFNNIVHEHDCRSFKCSLARLADDCDLN
jgi:hypothetical protein